MPISEHIARLRELTPMLPDLVVSSHDFVTDYAVEEGSSTGQGLINNDMVSLQQNSLTSGTTFQWHAHEVNEYLLVFEGKIAVVDSTGDEQIGEVGSFFHFRPNQGHSVRALEDSKVLGVLIPGGEGYPDAPE